MQRILAHGGHAVLLDLPEPELRPNEILVETAYSVVSAGTERGILQESAFPPGHERRTYLVDHPQPKLRSGGRVPVGPEPRAGIPGYESIGYSLAGRVLAVSPEVTDLRPGDRVACSGSQCAVHAERVAVPRNLVARVPDGLPLEQAAFVTVGTISMYSLRLANVQFGETVVLYGLGLLGLLAAQVARTGGIDTIGIDLDARRRAQALRFGTSRVIDPASEDAVAVVKELTDGFGADAVIVGVATESSEPLNQSFDMARHMATIVGLGAFGMAIERSRFGTADVTFRMARAYGPGRYDPVYEEGSVDYPIGFVRWTEGRNQAAFLRLLVEGKVDVRELSPGPIPFADAPAAYEVMLGPDRPPTMVFRWTGE